MSTGISIDPSRWKTSSQRLDEKNSAKAHHSNILIDKFRTNFEAVIHHLEYAGKQVTPENILKELNSKRISEKRIDLLKYFSDFIARIKAGQAITSAGRVFRPNTMKNYQKTYNHLLIIANGKSIPWAQVDLDFYNKFILYCNKAGYSVNHTGSMIKCIKAICKRALNENIHEASGWMAAGFKTISEDSQSIYLNEDELLKISECELTGRHSELRDLFILASFSGLRYSDLSKLGPANIKHDIIEIMQEKTGQLVSIPMHREVKRILEKYGHRLPSTITNQKFNEALKIIVQKAGIKDPQVITITKGGTRQELRGPKWQFVSTHTARRSFATNAYLAGISAYSIMQITGHKTEKAFLKYLKMTSKDNALKMLEHPFFKP